MNKIIIHRIEQKTMNDTYQEVQTPEKMRWKKVSNVFHSMALFKNPQIQKINNDQDLEENFYLQKKKCDKNFSQQQKKHLSFIQKVKDNGFDPKGYQQYFKNLNSENQFSLQLSQVKNEELFNQYINRGDEKDLQRIEFFIRNDYRNNLYAPDSPELMKNKVDNNGKTPIYKACSQGNLKLVQKLLEFETNIQQKCIIYQNKNVQITETPFEVTCRLGYTQIFTFLIERYEFDQQQLKYCNKITKNKLIKTLLTSKIKKKKSRFLCLPIK